jgi:hypothetical protein
VKPLRSGLPALVVCVLGAALAPRAAVSSDEDRSNVIVVTSDGLRWQEVFSGADPGLMTPVEGVRKPEDLKSVYWRETPAERRETLLPFLWGTVAKKGQIHGNRWRGSSVRVTNGKNFSYPGYNELLTGFADARIDSNDKRPNPNATVLEWLTRRSPFEGRVAAFCSWGCFPWILNRERCGFLVNAGWEPADGRPVAESAALGAEAGREIPGPWDDVRFDVLTFQAALEHLVRKKPRVLYVALGETDEWAHLGRYDEYLAAAHRADGFVRRLWETAESQPEYRGRTSLVFTTDHGRGDGHAWRDHGAKVPGAENIWFAFLGPRTAPLGEQSGREPLTQSQVAATVAALVGEDYRASVPQSAPPVTRAVAPPRLY